MITYQPIEWSHDRVRMLDQTRLPTAESYIETSDYLQIADAIRTLKVRGAPAIGVAGAYGIALAAMTARSGSVDTFRLEVTRAIQTIISTRPTARNLFWASERMADILAREESIEGLKRLMVEEAVAIHRQEVDNSLRLSRFGTDIVKDGDTVLTHCNTGPLATTGSGTALGIIVHASQQGKKIRVLVDETRPLLQGARLTTWELQKAGVGFMLITDSMAGYYMARGEVDSVIVGGDRIAANGDTANKIGTYGLAVLAKAHRVPFYVAAPTSTMDLQIRSGEQIEIEQRSSEEVTSIAGVRVAPAGVDAGNPAFDVTPAKLITAIITEHGIIKPPFTRAIESIQTGRTPRRAKGTHPS